MRKILLVVIIIAMTVTAYAADGYFMPDEIGVCEHPWGAILGDLPPVVLDDTTGWPQNPGWPQQLPTHPNFSPSRGTAIADIDGDGLLDIVASSNNQIYVFDYEGDILDGWPVTVINTAQGAPSVGDVDNDGEMEIVQGTRGTTSGGRLYMFNADGTVADGFPLNFSNQNPAASPTLYDLDDDGYLEIIIGTRDYPIGQLRVVRYNGSDYGGDWPIALDHVPTGSAAVGDVDNDGEPEIAYMSYNSIYLLNSDGTSLEGYPWTCSWGNFSYQSIALADINDDDYLELICANHGSSPAAFVLDYEGNTLTGWPHYFQRWTYSPPSVCDLDSDGDLEIIIGTAGSFSSPSDNLYAFHDNGDIVSGFPVTIQGSAEGPTAIGDLEGNGDNYIAFDNNIVRPSDGLGNIYICDESGYIDDPYPLMPYGFTYMNGIQVGDLNRNGVMELVSISAYEGIANASVWSQRGFYGENPIEWETYHADNHRTGLYNPMEGNNLPEAFNLLTPDSGYNSGCFACTLSWEAATDPDGDEVNYWIVYDTTANMINPTVQFVGTQTSITSDELQIEIPFVWYYWYVTSDDMKSGFVTSSNQKFWSFQLGGLNVDDESLMPDKISLSQNYPNPFNAQTTIKYFLEKDGDVKLTVYNIRGDLIEVLVDTTVKAGEHSVNFDALEYASGIYFYTLMSENKSITRRMVLLK